MATNTARITEVGPRDGLQNEKVLIPTDEKVRLVELLCQTRVDEIEVSSFVSPKWLPQLADAAEVFAAVQQFKPADMVFSALVPNEKGFERALGVNDQSAAQIIDKFSVFTAASETFSQKNTNATIAETIVRFTPVIARARENKLQTRGYVSCVAACPYEGLIAPSDVADVARQLSDIGVDEIDLGDTIGAATPEAISEIIEAVAAEVARDKITIHLHDTHGNAAACAKASWNAGIRSFDGAAGGLGGCPFASTADTRAPGNIATATLVAALREAGARIDIDDNALLAASSFAAQITESTA